MRDFDGLRDNLRSCRLSFTDDAISIVSGLLGALEEDESIDIQEYIYDSVANTCIYYTSAYEYFRECNITDFKDAFQMGLTGVCEIYSYYLEEECFDLIGDIGLDY